METKNEHIFHAERAVIRCVLDGKESTLKPEYFFGMDNAIIFKSLVETKDKVLTISNLAESDLYTMIGEDAYFEMLEGEEYKTDHFENYENVVKQAYLTRRYEKLGRDITGDPKLGDVTLESFYKELKELTKTNKWNTLEDALNMNLVTEYVVKDLIEFGSLTMLCGAPEAFKTFLALSMCLSVAAGLPWLFPDDGVHWSAFETAQVPVLWVDNDMGARRMSERLQALSRTMNLDPTQIPFYWISLPDFNANDNQKVSKLISEIQDKNIGLIGIDNLGTTSGGVNENTGEMIPVMYNFRRMSEETGAATLLLHHQRKKIDINTRSGDKIRGHSSIEAALDLGLLVTRDNDDDSGVIRSVKKRGRGIPPIAFRYKYSYEDERLYNSEFLRIDLKGDTSDWSIQEKICEVVKDSKGINKGNLAKQVKREMEEGNNNKVGINRIQNHIEQMARKSERIMQIETSGASKKYTTVFFEV